MINIEIMYTICEIWSYLHNIVNNLPGHMAIDLHWLYYHVTSLIQSMHSLKSAMTVAEVTEQ